MIRKQLMGVLHLFVVVLFFLYLLNIRLPFVTNFQPERSGMSRAHQASAGLPALLIWLWWVLGSQPALVLCCIGERLPACGPVSTQTAAM